MLIKSFDDIAYSVTSNRIQNSLQTRKESLKHWLFVLVATFLTKKIVWWKKSVVSAFLMLMSKEEYDKNFIKQVLDEHERKLNARFKGSSR